MITLISPQKLFSASAGFYIGRGGAAPLNLAYLARALDNAGIDYDIIDTLATDHHFKIEKLQIEAHGLSFEETVSKIDSKTEVIGISSMFTNEFLLVRELIFAIREQFPDVIIILGGEHPTAFPEATLKYENSVNYIFHGEAEESLVQFMKNFNEGKPLEQSPGIFYRKKNLDHFEVIRNERMPRMTDLDYHLPLWDKIPVYYYLGKKLSLSRIGVRSMPILATRGCPYRCTFCSNEEMWGTRYVMRSLDSVIGEMKSYVDKYEVEHFDFQDLSTSINKKWFTDLLERLKLELPGVTWEMTVGTRSEILDEQVLTLLKESGTTQLTYAPETGSYKLSKMIQKKINFHKLFQSIKISNRIGMEVKCHLIIGFPSETILDLIKTLFLGLRLGWYGVKGVSIYVFSAYPGSKLFEEKYDQKRFSREDYFAYLNYQLFNSAGARVFNPGNIIYYPREEFLTFLGNVFMVLAYFMSMIRFPKRFFNLIMNPLRGCPKNPLEIGIYFFLKKLMIVRKQK